MSEGHVKVTQRRSQILTTEGNKRLSKLITTPLAITRSNHSRLASAGSLIYSGEWFK